MTQREGERFLKDSYALATAKYWIVRGGIIFLMLVLSMMYGCPQYGVWQQELSGKAKLKEATYSRQIKVEEAQAFELAAQSLANAEVIRAFGVAEANSIIADGLGGSEGYLRYLWIQTLENGENDVIYIPTEAGIPILEAKRLK